MAVGASFVVALVTTPLFGWAARRFRLVVPVREDRWHRTPTPLLGGGAMALAVLVLLAISLPLSTTALTVVVCAALSFALGLLDDFRSLSPSTKLAGQVIVASVLVVGGVRVEIIPFAPLAFIATVFWVVAIMNAINLSDNMDGLAAGVAAIGAIALGITSLPKDPIAAYVAGATAGAALGFLAHNFHPARIFMGDAGSLLLGFLLAAAALLHTTPGATNLGLAVFAPLAVLALPIFDSALVTASRRFAGRPVNRGGRDHTSHRLAALGLSDRAAVAFLWVVAALSAGLAIVAETVSGLLFPLAALAVIGLFLFGSLVAEVDVYGERAPRRHLLSGRFATYGRFGAEIALDVVLLTVAYYVSHLIRFEGVPEGSWMYLFIQTVPVVVGVQIATLVGMGTYRTLWRFLGIEDVSLMVRALTLGSLVSSVVLLFGYQQLGFSRAALVLDWIIGAALVLGARVFLLWLRHWFAVRPTADERRVLIIGASDAGVLALRLMGRLQDAKYRPVGFLDDDPGKRYRRVAGIPVVGYFDDLDAVVARLNVDLVLYALEFPIGERREQMRLACAESGIEWREFAVPTGRALGTMS